MSKCKSCGAEIVWIKTQSGKSMPCDAGKVNYIKDGTNRKIIVTPEGHVYADVSITASEYGRMGYVPHWATCPFSDYHRRAK